MSFIPRPDMQVSLSSLQDELGKMFERVWHAGVSTGPLDGQEWAPVVDLYERVDHYTLYAELPGVEGSAVELSHVGQTLTIRGEKAQPSGIGPDDRTRRSERRFGSFCRTIDLPGEIDAAKIAAKCHAGVLEVTIPKAAGSVPKAIKVASPKE